MILSILPNIPAGHHSCWEEIQTWNVSLNRANRLNRIYKLNAIGGQERFLIIAAKIALLESYSARFWSS